MPSPAPPARLGTARLESRGRTVHSLARSGLCPPPSSCRLRPRLLLALHPSLPPSRPPRGRHTILLLLLSRRPVSTIPALALALALAHSSPCAAQRMKPSSQSVRPLQRTWGQGSRPRFRSSAPIRDGCEARDASLLFRIPEYETKRARAHMVVLPGQIPAHVDIPVRNSCGRPSRSLQPSSFGSAAPPASVGALYNPMTSLPSTLAPIPLVGGAPACQTPNVKWTDRLSARAPSTTTLQGRTCRRKPSSHWPKEAGRSPRSPALLHTS